MNKQLIAKSVLITAACVLVVGIVWSIISDPVLLVVYALAALVGGTMWALFELNP